VKNANLCILFLFNGFEFFQDRFNVQNPVEAAQ